MKSDSGCGSWETFEEGKEEEACSRWAYSGRYFASTLITRWDLVCGSALAGKTMLSAVGAVTVGGCIAFAWLSDRFGRKVNCLPGLGPVE